MAISKCTLGLFCFLIMLGCEQTPPKVERVFSFYVAGHTYGKPGVDNVGLHPPFESKFDWINQDSLIEFGVLTGDIVHVSNEKNWDEVDSSLKRLNVFNYFAPGNHDASDSEIYKRRYGSGYYSFYHRGNLFLVLDPNLDQWNISGDQLDYLKRQLKEMPAQTKNIFVFSHQLIWWNEQNVFKNIQINSAQGKGEEINFWDEIEPLFRSLKQEVVFMAGDVGAFSTGDEYVYHKHEGIHYIASGMGGGNRDNMILVDLMSDQSFKFQLIALNGDDLNRLGSLEDYILE